MRHSKPSLWICSCMSLVVLTLTTPVFGQFAYVSNFGDNDVSGYTINATTGALTPIPGSPISAGLEPVSVAVDPTGKFVYVANFSAGSGVSGYTINATSGALTSIPGSPFPDGVTPHSAAVDPTGRFAYVVDFQDGNVSGYTINATTGVLTPIPGSPFPAGVFPQSVALDPTGKFGYVANIENGFHGDISAYMINATTGALMPIPGSPFAAGLEPASVAVHPMAKFAYVANTGNNDVSAYTINATTGALTPIPGSPFPAGAGPTSVVVDPTGKFAYVANFFASGGNGVSGYTINATTGVLMPIPGSPFPAGVSPVSVAVDPTGKFAYVANDGSADVSGYMINPITGVLTAIPGSPFPAGISPTSVTTTPLLTVQIDVKPGEDPPTINPKSRGKITVAILSTPTFNAPAQVATASLTFGRTGSEQSLAFCNPHGEDVNGDGLADLVCHFNTQTTGFQTSDTVGILKGKTVNSIPIRGTDSIIVK